MGMTFPPNFAEWHNLEMYGDHPQEYLDRITRDFEAIEPWLPAKVSSVLDIGCGLAGVNVLIAKATGCKKINLIDGDGTGPRKMGFVENTPPWFDVNIGAEFVRKNTSGVAVKAFHQSEKSIPCDLLISLKSWAHHYSAETYMALAVASLRKKGELYT